MLEKDKLIKQLSASLSKCIDYILRLEAISGSKAINRPDILGLCRFLTAIKKGGNSDGELEGKIK